MGAVELKTRNVVVRRRTLGARYVLGPFIARGSSADVVEAIDLSTINTVAIKRMRPGASHECARHLFMQARVLERLSHRGCARLLDQDTDCDRPFLVMEHIDGEPLSTQLAGGVPEDTALGWIEGILLALEHVHARGFVHRDVKPDNVMLRRDVPAREAPVVVDFGAAMSGVGTRREECTLTMAGLMSGTPAYMSPEHAMGLELDPRSDLYSVGMIAYQLIAGRPAFHEDDPVALLQRHVAGGVPRIPSASKALEAFVLRLCARLREDRFSSATEALGALCPLRSGRPRPHASALYGVLNDDPYEARR